MKFGFKRISDWITIENDTFKFNNVIYCLSDFVRIHDNKWISSDYFPDYIHGVDGTRSENPYYIEVDPSGNEVRVYQKITNEVN